MDSAPKWIVSIVFAAVIAGSAAAAPRYAVAVYYVGPVSGGAPDPSMGAPVYYGLPRRPYEVLGVGFGPVRGGQLAEYVALRAMNSGGDAIIVLRLSPRYDGNSPIEIIRFKH